MSPLLHLLAGTAFVASPVGGLSYHQSLMLALELKTAAICLIQRGSDPIEVMGSLYAFMDEEGLRYPHQSSQTSDNLWRLAIKQASPQTCNRILNTPVTTYKL
jgi:hypothetical protein